MIKPTVDQNMKAAEICGYDTFVIKQMWSVEDAVYCDKQGNEIVFTLSNKADLLDTVIALGEKHGICIGYKKAESPKVGGWAKEPEYWYYDSQTIWGRCFNTHLEAVLAAVDEIEL